MNLPIPQPEFNKPLSIAIHRNSFSDELKNTLPSFYLSYEGNLYFKEVCVNHFKNNFKSQIWPLQENKVWLVAKV